MSIVWLILLLMVLVAGWFLNLLTLPGNWINVGATAIYAWLIPLDQPFSFGWTIVVVVLLLAVAGEALEFAAGVVGTTQAGGSRRGAVLALLGSLIGSVVGMILGSGVPVVGTVIVGLLGACVGALLGAMLGEYWKGRNLAQVWHVGHAAFWGRFFGTLAKAWLGAAIVAVVGIALVG
jgi:uncharacterized protein YqgC (DUF456 family)